MSQDNANERRALDNLLLFIASIIGLFLCLTIVGLIPVALLIFGLVMSIRHDDIRSVELTTKIMYGLCGIVAAIFFFMGVSNSMNDGFGAPFPDRERDGAFIASVVFCLAGLGFKYLWLDPLTRQIGAIRAFVFMDRQKKAKVIDREALAAYSVADELAKWSKLRADGVVTEEEYKLARARLIDGD